MVASFGAWTRPRAAGLLARRALNGRGPGLVRQAAVRFYATTLEKDYGGLQFKDDELGNSWVSKFWLRDNCRCNMCVNQDTMQRNFNTFDISESINLSLITPQDEGVDIKWSDGHESSYTWDWLRSTVPGRGKSSKISEDAGKLFWNSGIANKVPEINFLNLMNMDKRAGMAELTEKIRVFGFCLVINTPKTPEATKRFLERIGPIRNTHYGGFYDFVPDLAKADTAYTNQALEPHTDTAYFSDPAGLQAFHLLSHTQPENEKGSVSNLGGETILVDGFYAAHRLRKEWPSYFNNLRRSALPWHASGNVDVSIAPDQPYPVIETLQGGSILRRVRWNNDDRGVVPTHLDVQRWYDAARKWSEIVNRRVNQYRFQLFPGQILILDNWRVLHGRTAFKGHRRICGAYINRDDFISRWKTSNFDREDVIASNMVSKQPEVMGWMERNR